MKLTAYLFFGLLPLLTACYAQTGVQQITTEQLPIGDTVQELGNNIMVIYQDKKNTYWFGSWQTGVYRYDGKTLVN